VIVKEMVLGNSVERRWNWRRNLFVWEERFKE